MPQLGPALAQFYVVRLVASACLRLLAEAAGCWPLAGWSLMNAPPGGAVQRRAAVAISLEQCLRTEHSQTLGVAAARG